MTKTLTERLNDSLASRSDTICSLIALIHTHDLDAALELASGDETIETYLSEAIAYADDPTDWDELRDDIQVTLCDYALCFDRVPSGTFDGQTEGYYRYQISWGGPSEEIRFYEHKTEYWFLDWFCGECRVVTNEPWIEDLKEQLGFGDLINFEGLGSDCDYEYEYSEDD